MPLVLRYFLRFAIKTTCRHYDYLLLISFFLVGLVPVLTCPLCPCPPHAIIFLLFLLRHTTRPCVVGPQGLMLRGAAATSSPAPQNFLSKVRASFAR